MGQVIELIDEASLIEEYERLVADIESTCKVIGSFKFIQALNGSESLARELELEEQHLEQRTARLRQVWAKLDGAGARSSSSSSSSSSSRSAPAGPAFPPAS